MWWSTSTLIIQSQGKCGEYSHCTLVLTSVFYVLQIWQAVLFSPKFQIPFWLSGAEQAAVLRSGVSLVTLVIDALYSNTNTHYKSESPVFRILLKSTEVSATNGPKVSKVKVINVIILCYWLLLMIQ